MIKSVIIMGAMFIFLEMALIFLMMKFFLEKMENRGKRIRAEMEKSYFENLERVLSSVFKK